MILTEIGILSSIFPLLILFINRDKTHHNLWWVLSLLAFVWFSAETTNWFLANNGIENMPVFHFYDFISTLLYLWLFRLTLGSKLPMFLIFLIGGCYTVLTWFNIIYFDCFYRAITINSILTVLIPLLLSVYGFYVIAKEAKITNLMMEVKYWIYCAVLIHFGVSLVSNISLELMNENLSLQIYLWPLISVSNILHNILFAIGVWKMKE